MKLREIAYTRCGDKGDVMNVAVFPYDDDDYQRLLDGLTVEVVAEKFGPLVRGTITRYEVPGLCGLNFVMTQALDGGVSMSLRPDPHGKAYQPLFNDIDIK